MSEIMEFLDYVLDVDVKYMKMHETVIPKAMPPRLIKIIRYSLTSLDDAKLWYDQALRENKTIIIKPPQSETWWRAKYYVKNDNRVHVKVLSLLSSASDYNLVTAFKNEIDKLSFIAEIREVINPYPLTK